MIVQDKVFLYHFEKKSVYNTKKGTGSRDSCPSLDVQSPPPVHSCRKEAFKQQCRGRPNANSVPLVFALAHRIRCHSSDR